MANVLVTGGAGFIGSALIRHILNQPDFEGSVLNVDKLTYAANLKALESVSADSRYRLVKADIAEIDVLGEVFEEFSPDIVIHLAAETHVDRSIEDPFEFVRTNVLGTCNLLHLSLKTCADNSQFRFIHVSTDEVYGSLADGESAVEDAPYRPNSPYSASKAASDHMARAWNITFGLPVVTTNCTNNYGPFQYPEKLIPLITLNAIYGHPLPIYGDGSNIRDWLFVDDHVSAIWRVANRGQVGSSYNISGGAELTNLEVVEKICAILDQSHPKESGESYKSLIKFVENRPGHDHRYSLDSTKLQQELDWSPSKSFEEGLRLTVDWYARNAEDISSNTGAVFLKRKGLLS